MMSLRLMLRAVRSLTLLPLLFLLLTIPPRLLMSLPLMLLLPELQKRLSPN